MTLKQAVFHQRRPSFSCDCPNHAILIVYNENSDCFSAVIPNIEVKAMSKEITFELLADCSHHIPQISELWFKELGQEWVPNASAAKAEKYYSTHLNRDDLPLTWVALSGDQPIAIASLRTEDGIRKDLAPWLGSLVVHPDYRGQGLGEKLIDLIKQQAREMGYEKLYLFTLHPTIPNWYAKLGWKSIAVDKFFNHPVTVMESKLTVT